MRERLVQWSLKFATRNMDESLSSIAHNVQALLRYQVPLDVLGESGACVSTVRFQGQPPCPYPLTRFRAGQIAIPGNQRDRSKQTR